MADFKDYLYVRQHNGLLGHCFQHFDYCWSQEDLANSTIKILDFGEWADEKKIHQLIEDFSPSKEEASRNIEYFKKYSRIELTEEY